MARVREQLVRDAASRGKYAPLYRHLSTRTGSHWRASFSEIEAILGFELPRSARLYRPWWANQKRDAGHSHALAWQAAGWRTRKVDLEMEALVFARADASSAARAMPAGSRDKFDLDAFWPAIPGGTWAKDFTMRRDEIYDECGRLTGGPRDDAGNGG